jgi:hypothetical protein
MRKLLSRGRVPALVLPVLTGVLLLPQPSAARADIAANLAGATTVGVHNTYNPDTYPYLASGLDSGTGLVELDVWSDIATQEWKVSHSNPLGNGNNCVNATAPADLYTGGKNKDLESCLDDIRVWLGAHPGHPVLMLKIELKAGFDANAGMGPARLDTAIRGHLGSLVYRPADLLAGHASLDAAARANAWPQRGALAGRVIVEIIPGSFEESNPFDSLWTDVEYARYLKGLAAAGQIGQAEVFPSVHNAQTGDPRTRYSDTTLRPWFVVFDGDAATYVANVDTSWYDTNHYLLVMTDAQNVPPPIDDSHPTVDQARARVAELAARHASVVSSDWATLTTVLPEVLPRG